MSNTIETTVTGATARSRPGRTIAFTVGLLGIALLAQIIVGAVASVSYLSLGGAFENPWAVVVLTIPTQLVILGVGYLFVTRYLGGLRAALPSRTQLGLVAGATVLMLALNAAGNIALSRAGVVTPPDAMLVAASAQPLILLAFAVLSLVLVGPAEEFLFRGAVQGNLRTAFGPAVAIGATAAVFGLIHVSNFLAVGAPLTVAVWASIGLVVLNGVIYGGLYERTGNLTVPILAHGLFNAVGFVFYFVTI
jgi:membrane protease YdiL (CAAX protease family)